MTKINRVGVAALITAMGLGTLRAEEADRQTPFPPLAPSTIHVPAVSSASMAMATVAQMEAEGLAAFQTGNFDGAREAYQRVLKLEPDNVTALVNLGATEFRLGHSSEAERLLTRSLQIKADNPTAWLNLGIVYLGRNEPMRALGAVATALADAPDDAVARNYLGLAAGRLGWRDLAESELRRAVELKPDYADGHFNLAVFYLERNPPAVELARRHYFRARELGAAPDKLLEKELKK